MKLTKASYPTYIEEYQYDKAGNRTKRILREQKQSIEFQKPALSMTDITLTLDTASIIYALSIVNNQIAKQAKKL